MKVAQHFRAFLETHYYLQLPAIGRFQADSNGREFKHSENHLQFIPDKSPGADMELVNYVSKIMKVERCIAESDLVCFSHVIHEFLIQGLEVEIPGIGFLHKEKADRLVFSANSIYKNAAVKKRLPAVASPSFWL